jgi:hypothetical protein
MEAPTPDGYLIIDTIRPRPGESAVRHFNFRDIRSWKRGDDGVTVIEREDKEGRRLIHFFPWRNIAELEWRINSDAYRKAYDEYESFVHLNHTREDVWDDNCPRCNRERRRFNPSPPPGIPKLPPMTHTRFP